MKKAFSNFWIRNAVFFLFVLILARINNDKESYSAFDRFKVYLSYFVDYVWVLVHNKILVERFLLRKKIKVYFLLLPLSYLAYFFFFCFFDHYPISLATAITGILNLSAIKLLGLGLYFIVRYIIDRERFYKASLTAKDLEMQLLKGQLNPHFLFNALNNIYSDLITGSKNGQELILKLSELMRYILDSNKKEFVTLGEEIRFIENYMTFEKERLGERCEIVLTKNIEDSNVKIAPLILFTFIENAFKHGTLAIQKSTILISIEAAKGKLQMQVSNPIFPSEQNSTKIGLNNTKRRLELLYPESHRIKIDTSDNRYHVQFYLTALA
jgi:hypothetical protein